MTVVDGTVLYLRSVVTNWVEQRTARFNHSARRSLDICNMMAGNNSAMGMLVALFLVAVSKCTDQLVTTQPRALAAADKLTSLPYVIYATTRAAAHATCV